MPTNDTDVKPISISPEQAAMLLQKIEALETRLSEKEKLGTHGFTDGTKKEEPFHVTIGVYKGPDSDKDLIITSWEVLRDEVVNINGNILVDQQTELTLEDDSKVKMDTRDFLMHRHINRVEVLLDMEKSVFDRVIQGKDTFKVIKEAVFTYNGREGKLLPTFINV